jgi:DNA-directed RNA polymerase specialized sigma54-like protein
MNTSEFRRLIAEAEAMVEAVEIRERELARAAEQLSQDAAVKAAFRDGIEHMRQLVLKLISIQLDMLSRGGTNALLLDALRRQVREAGQ